VPEQTRKAEFDGSQGGKLAAALELPRGRPIAFVLFAHCFSCTKDIRAAREIARSLRAAGFAVLRFDFTGLGASEGDFANTNFSSNVDDLVAAADFLRREFEAPAILIGHSLGGAAVLEAAARIPEVKGVAVIGAPAEAAHVLQHIGEKRDEIERSGRATVSLSGRPFTIKKQFLDDLENARVLDAAAALRKPLLIMHGPLDQTVGIENATKLFVAAKHPKSFVSLDTADHLLSDPADARYAAVVLAAWAGRYVDAPAPEAVAAAPPPTADSGAVVSTIGGRDYAVEMIGGGHRIVADAPAHEGGDDLGPTPTRLAEIALGACGAMTMKMYARRKGWALTGATVAIAEAEGEGGHLVRRMRKTVTLEGELDPDQRRRLLEIADKCPVHRMLTEGVAVESSLA
jgi:putative redox protein